MQGGKMLVQFYKHDNLIRVFGGQDNAVFLFDIKDAIRSHAGMYLGFKAKASDWTKADWGSEIELI